MSTTDTVTDDPSPDLSPDTPPSPPPSETDRIPFRADTAPLRGLSALLESSTVQTYVIDRNQRIVYVNQADADAVGIPREQLVGKTLPELNAEFQIPDAFVQRQQEETLHVLTTGEAVRGEL